MQRLEFSFKIFKFALHETVVYRKRFEPMYLLPIGVYWFSQNAAGDLDDLVGGFDFSFLIKNVGEIYAGLTIDEFTAKLSPKAIIKDPRNIMAFQLGFKGNSSFGSFGQFRLQYTYVPPFFGSHGTRNYLNNQDYCAAYVNKGQTLSYPMFPDSMEFLIGYAMNMKRGWSLDILIKDQVRSAQYAGFEHDKSGEPTRQTLGLIQQTDLVYDVYVDGHYSDKNFFKNIWENLFSVGVTATKHFEGFPIELSAGFNVMVDWRRDYEVKRKDITSSGVTYKGINTGSETSYGSWNPPIITPILALKCKIYF